MTTDRDPAVAARFAAFRSSTALAVPGGPDARALGNRQKRRTALVGIAAVVLALAGISTLLLVPGGQPDQLVPATAPTTAQPAPDDWKQTVRNARIDLRPETNANCGGPLLQFRDGKATGKDRAGQRTNYTIEDGFPMLTADIDRDGRIDYLVSISCDWADRPPCPPTDKACASFEKMPHGVVQLFVLRGTPENLTTVGGIRGMTSLPDQTGLHVTIRPDSLIRIEDDRDPGYILIWGYRDGQMKVIKRWVLTASPTASPSATG